MSRSGYSKKKLYTVWYSVRILARPTKHSLIFKNNIHTTKSRNDKQINNNKEKNTMQKKQEKNIFLLVG